MLDLYYMQNCPYCKKVLNYLSANGIDFDAKDVSEKVNYNELLSIGHIDQVPFLVDKSNGTSMYDSDMIISYIEKQNR